MKVTKGRLSKGVIVAAGSKPLATVVVPGQGRVNVLNNRTFVSAKSAASSRLNQAIKTMRDANQK